MPVYDITIVGKAYLPDIGYPLPQPPLGIWGGSSPGVLPQPYPGQGLPGNQPYPGQGLPGNQPYPGQGLPGNQPYPDQGLPGIQPRPSHPIFYPPGIWGPIFYPDQGLPGNQPYPSLPIYYPPGIWGGGNQPFPTPPIYIPIPPPGSTDVPSHPVNEPPTDSPYWMQVFLPGVGWVWAIIPKPPSGSEEAESPLVR